MINVESDNDEVISPDQLDSQFGDSQPKNFKKFEKTTYFNLKNGDNVYRIMPAMFSCLEAGHWSVYYAKHFGYTNEDGKAVNYICLREYDNQTGAMIQDCPFCLDQEQKKKDMERLALEVNDLQNKLHAARVSGGNVAEVESQLEDTKEAHNKARNLYNPRSARFWVNAMNMTGEFGLLPLPKTVYEALVGKKVQDARNPSKYTRSQGLLQRIKEKDKLDALSVNEGVWFVITREGSTQFDTEYKISVLKEEIELGSGDIVEKTKRSTLSDQQKREALTKCKDLRKVFDHIILSPEQAKSAANGSGKSVSAVMNQPVPTQTTTVPTPSARPTKMNTASVLDKFRKLDAK
jgi:hypothetical protein